MINNIESIKRNFNTIYFFENVFIKTDKLATSKLATFIIDREDEELIERLSNICKELEDPKPFHMDPTWKIEK